VWISISGDTLEYKKKIVLLGDSAVGKTSLIRRYVFDHFDDSYISTIGSKVTMKKLKISKEGANVDLTLMIWDLIGREGYHALHSRTFVGVQGALLVTDLTRKETLGTLERYWIPSLFKVVDSVPMIFACNKSDLKGEYEFEPGDLTDITSRYNSGSKGLLPPELESGYPTSAKTGENVERLFESIGHLLLTNQGFVDPVKELYESVVALGVNRTSDKRTPIGALDAIIVDFCAGFEDSRLAMLILRQEIARAGIDVANPTKKGILKAVEFLAEAEADFLDEKIVLSNLERRMKWASRVKR
jgi:small GTP-binding protein